MSNFRTQVNFSSQIKEYPNTDGTLSGSVNVQQYTILGTDYLDLPLGLDGSTTGITSTFFPTTYGTFTGTTGSTTFFFSDPNMDLGIPYLSALTPSNSGITQNVEVYIPLTTLIVDGNSFDIYYSGVSYDLVASNMYEYTPGEFSGITFTNVLEYISGTTYPWWFLKSGSTTWNEVKGRTQTDRLTVVEGANPGYVLTSSNSDGDAVWLPVSGGSFTGGTGTCITDLYVSNIHACSPLNINPLDEGNVYFGSTSGLTFDITNKRLGLNQPNPEYTFDFKSSDGNTRLHYLDTTPTAQSIYFSGNSTVMPQLGISSRLSSLPLTIGFTMGIVGENVTLYPGAGNPLDSFIYAGADSNRLNIINAPTSSVSTNSDDIRFYAGQFVNSGFGADIHIQGSGTTRGFVGVGTETPTTKLHISGDTIVNSDYLMLSDTLTTIPALNFKGFVNVQDSDDNIGYFGLNLNSSGETGLFIYNESVVGGGIETFGSNHIRGGGPHVVGSDFYRNKILVSSNNSSDGMVIKPKADDPSATLWFEMDTASVMILKGDGISGSGNAFLGLALNPDGAEMPTSNLQIGGTGTTGTFQYIDGNQASGYVLTSDTDGNATWQVPTNFTGNTSASCITDLYVTNVHGCSPITFWDQLQHNSSTASTIYNTAFGYQTQSLGNYSHSEGIYTIASGNGSHAGGWGDSLTSSVIASARGSFNHSIVTNTYSGTGSSNLSTFILGGINNTVSAEYSGILGGGDNSILIGGLPVPYSCVIVGGSGNVIKTGINSVILGGYSMTGTTSNTVYVPDFVIKKVAAVPTSSTDPIGEIGSITYDDDTLYIKTPRSGGTWGKVSLNISW